MSTPDRSARVTFLPSVRVRLGAERGFLFDERTGRVYSLNETAAFATARLREAASLGAVVEAVVGAFEADEPSVRRDLLRFTDQLVAEGLARMEAGRG